MTRAEAERALTRLSEIFGVPRPRLEWRPDLRAGLYSQDRHTVKLGPNCWRGTDSLLHEFSHHLCAARESLDDYHGREFFNALVAVTGAWYGNEKAYDWQTEYATVRARAVLEGLLSAPVARGPLLLASAYRIQANLEAALDERDHHGRVCAILKRLNGPGPKQ